MASSVNRPTDPKQKEQDVNQKLQLFGIFTAFSKGKVPSNAQIDVALNSALASRALSSPSAKLSSEGRELVNDLRTVIEQAKILLLTKNEGNLLQDFIWQTQNISTSDKALPGAPVDKGTAQQHGNQALDGLRTLGTLIISNGQFRKLLSDATILLRDIAGDAAQKAANRVNPSEDQLSQIDRPADDNTWHDVPSAGGLKAQARDTMNKNKLLSRSDVKNAANNAANSDDTQAGAQNQAYNLKDQALNNMDDENKAKAQDLANTTRDRSRQYLSNKLPDDRRDQTIWRLKKMIAEIQGHEDYHQAIDTLLSLAETYAGHANSLGQSTSGTVKGVHSDNALSTAEADLRTLIERFANSTSADDLIESVNNIYRDADRDPELKNWFKQINSYIRRCLKQQGFILQDSARDEWNKLYDDGNFLLRERYRDHTNRVLNELKFVADQFDKDPQNKAFAEAMNRLFLKLGNDENGKPTFKPHLIKDLTQVIIPGIFERTRYVPIPRIEYSDPMIDAIVENLVIESDNLFPNSLEITSDNFFKWGRRTTASRNKNKIMVSVSGIQMDLKDVSYYIHKKQGFPSLKDTGIMDLYMGGTGLSFKLGLETADAKDRRNFFKVNSCVVDVKHLKVKAKQSNHKLLFNLASPLLLKLVRPAVQKIIQKQIVDKVHQGDAFAYSIYQEADKATQQAKNDPGQAQNIYQRYVTAAQRKMERGKAKTQEATADKKANVALTQNDSMFKNIRLPGGISTKATDYQELAAKGDRWESPIFSIGSAPASTNIPKPTPVTRKHHGASAGGLDRQNDPSYNANSTYGSNSAYVGDTASYGSQVGGSYGGQPGVGYRDDLGGYPNQASADYDRAANDLSTKGHSNGTYNTVMGMNNPVVTGTV